MLNESWFNTQLIPKLAVIHTIQFTGDGYSPEKHGHYNIGETGSGVYFIDNATGDTPRKH